VTISVTCYLFIKDIKFVDKISDVIASSWTMSKSCKPHNKKHGQACVNKSKVCGYKSQESFAAAAEKRPANDSPRRLVFSYLPQKPTEQAVACPGRQAAGEKLPRPANFCLSLSACDAEVIFHPFQYKVCMRAKFITVK
jgi:hypothetical protein